MLRRHAVVLILLLVFGSRLPFLWSGYGSDPDAWRVAKVAKDLWSTCAYEVSRFPGYPLHELVSAPLVGLGGAFLSNGATLIATLVLLFGWWKFVEHRAHHPLILLVSLSFLPLLWLNSATTMDYVWSLLFLVASLHNAVSGRAAMSGVMLGIAAGFRPTNLVCAFPLAILLLSNKRAARPLVVFAATALLTSFVAFAIVLLNHGIDGWLDGIRIQSNLFQISLKERLLSFLYRTTYSVGPFGAAAFAILILLQRKTCLKKIRLRDPLFLASLVGMGVFLALFYYAPLDRSYLLPAFPFLLLVVDAVATRTQLVALCVCFASFAFFNPDSTHHVGTKRELSYSPRVGIVVEEYQKRVQILKERGSLPQLVHLAPAIIITGIDEQFWFENELVERDTTAFSEGFRDVVMRSTEEPKLLFVALMNREEIERARSAGYTPLCLEERQLYIESFVGDPMETARVQVLSRLQYGQR